MPLGASVAASSISRELRYWRPSKPPTVYTSSPRAQAACHTRAVFMAARRLHPGMCGDPACACCMALMWASRWRASTLSSGAPPWEPPSAYRMALWPPLALELVVSAVARYARGVDSSGRWRHPRDGCHASAAARGLDASARPPMTHIMTSSPPPGGPIPGAACGARPAAPRMPWCCTAAAPVDTATSAACALRSIASAAAVTACASLNAVSEAAWSMESRSRVAYSSCHALSSSARSRILSASNRSRSAASARRACSTSARALSTKASAASRSRVTSVRTGCPDSANSDEPVSERVKRGQANKRTHPQPPLSRSPP